MPNHYKSVPLMWGDHRHEDIKGALEPLDEFARKMELKWGVDKLIKLVSPGTSDKFRLAEANFHKAADVDDHFAFIQKTENLLRGWKVMDKEAEKLGYTASTDKVWHFEFEGERFCLAQSFSDLALINEAEYDRGFTIRELALIIFEHDEKSKEFKKVKEAFKTSQIINFESKKHKTEKISLEDLDDEIPF